MWVLPTAPVFETTGSEPQFLNKLLAPNGSPQPISAQNGAPRLIQSSERAHLPQEARHGSLSQPGRFPR